MRQEAPELQFAWASMCATLSCGYLEQGRANVGLWALRYGV